MDISTFQSNYQVVLSGSEDTVSSPKLKHLSGFIQVHWIQDNKAQSTTHCKSQLSLSSRLLSVLQAALEMVPVTCCESLGQSQFIFKKLS